MYSLSEKFDGVVVDGERKGHERPNVQESPNDEQLKLNSEAETK